MKAESFEFTGVEYTKGNPEIVFTYKMDFVDSEPLVFIEKITVADKDWVSKLPADFVTNILRDLHLVFGISYYKTFCPPTFKHSYQLTEKQSTFWNTLYHKGLGEFVYKNNLSFSQLAKFSVTDEATVNSPELPVAENSLLVGIGGGKDSIVALELLKKKFAVTGFVKTAGGSAALASAVAEIADIPLTTIEHQLDQQLLKGIEGSYNGHVPVSAMYAFLGVLNAAIEGHRYFVVANEYGTSFGSTEYDGEIINHKWSGSAEFEALLQEYLREFVSPSVGYFSIIRPFYELRVVKEFTELGRDYFHTFTSCNRNFAHNKETLNENRWCGTCAKCAFGFLTLSAFLSKDEVVDIFKKDLFEDETMLPMFRDLLGFGDMKPFDCIGTFEEARYALWLAAGERDDSLVVKELLPLLRDIAVTDEVMKSQLAETVPTKFRMVGMHSALILGYGAEGKITEDFLEEEYPKVTVGITDQSSDENYLEQQNNFDIVIKTPGIPQSKITRQYTTATQFFFNRIRREQIIGVTGSKGKSTTASLLAKLLEAGDKDVRLIGNIGTPALSILQSGDYTDETIFVFELSSYQLEKLDVSPHIAVVTAIFPEHLDHHGGMEAYLKAKHSIVANQMSNDVFVYNPKYKILEEWAGKARSKKKSVTKLPFAIMNEALNAPHMLENAALAFEVASEFGVTEATAKEVMENFVGLPHRLQKIAEIDGVTYFDDSISTTPESTIAALRAIPNVKTILLGGVDRGYDFTELETELISAGVKNIILFPESGEKMIKNESNFNVLHTKKMEEAVAFARENTPDDGVCLLSPAAPSYNLFKNFEARGQAFIDAIKKYELN